MTIHSINKSKLLRENAGESNPLLSGLKLVSSETEMLKLIVRDPFRDHTWRSNNHDIDLFRLYLQQVVVPTKDVLHIGLSVHKALKISLYQQDPEKHSNRIKYFSPGSELVKSNFLTGIYVGISILGLTGTAKSHLIKAALATIPQYIERINMAGLKSVIQINWIYIDLSVTSVEALAERIVDEIDFILRAGGKLRESTFNCVRGANAKMTAAIRLLKTHFCGLLILDEIQFGNFGAASAAPIRSWLLRIANLDIGLVLSGNPLGFNLQLPNKPTKEEVYSTQIMRRFCSTDKIRLDPAPSASDYNWMAFTKGIRRCRLNGPPHPLIENLEQLKFELTGGFPDFYVDLHVSLEEILSKNPNKTINKELICLAAKQSSKLEGMQPLITAFAHKDSIALRLCDDVDHNYYQKLWVHGHGEGHAGTTGPVGVIAIPASKADPAKSLAEDKKAAERASKKRMNKATKKVSPEAAAVRDHLLDQLSSIIEGKTINPSDSE